MAELAAGPDDIFADMRLATLRNMQAAGMPVGDGELEKLREQIRNRDPACWHWPAPESITFKNDDDARRFLNWWHNGMCAACGVRGVGDLVTDHDHRSGNIRGRLCRSCNSLEGHADDAGTFGKYRRRNPASILGIQIRYWAPFTGLAEPEPEVTDEDHAAMRSSVDGMKLPPTCRL